MGVFGSSGHSSFTGEWERQRASRKLTQVPWLEHGSWRDHRPRDWFVDGLGMMRGRFVVVLAAEWGELARCEIFHDHWSGQCGVRVGCSPRFVC